MECVKSRCVNKVVQPTVITGRMLSLGDHLDNGLPGGVSDCHFVHAVAVVALKVRDH